MLHLHMFQIPFRQGHKQTVLFFVNLQEVQVALSLRFIDKMKKSTLDQIQTVLKNYLTY